MGRNPVSLRQAFRFAWPAFKKCYLLFASVLLTIFAAWAALEIVVITGQRFGLLLWIAAHLTFLVFFAGVEVGFLRICLSLAEGKEPVFADAFKHLALGPAFLVGQILYLILVVVGLALLIAPGIFLSVRYAMFGFCIAAGETSLTRSFQQSAILSAGTMWPLFAALVALLSLNVLGACLLGLGLFVTVPLSALLATEVFRQLSRPGN
ncbi:MAG TPA: hypothetical protein VJX29_07325 [Candidatus Acidoferrales bacterium]|nr:hypothetical protein [Candidatus Acidoferrales bacterium]